MSTIVAITPDSFDITVNNSNYGSPPKQEVCFTVPHPADDTHNIVNILHIEYTYETLGFYEGGPKANYIALDVDNTGGFILSRAVAWVSSDYPTLYEVPPSSGSFNGRFSGPTRQLSCGGTACQNISPAVDVHGVGGSWSITFHITALWYEYDLSGGGNIGCTNCAYDLNPIARHFTVTGGSGDFALALTPDSCEWQVLTYQSWVHITPPTSGIGDAIVSYTVDANPNPASRSAAIYASGFLEHIITQDGTDEGGGPPDGDLTNAACLETDGPRAWLHIGGGTQVQTFHTTQNAFNFGGQPAPASIRGLATDRRRGALAILSETEEETTWKLYVSTDGGQSAELVKTMTYKSACLAYDSERGALVVMGATVADAIEWNVSRDGGATWESPIAATKDDGNPLTGQVKDIAHDTRAAVFALLLDTGSAMQVWTSGEVGKSWTLALG